MYFPVYYINIPHLKSTKIIIYIFKIFLYRQEIWKLSRDFGADCEYELSDKTTHLISNRIDTEKALESRERGIPAVKPDWIYECCRKWERLDWSQFKISISGTRRQKRSATELEGAEFEDFVGEIPDFKPILDEAELEEIEKELLDLESEDISDDDSQDESENDNNFDSIAEEGAELSDGDFSDLLNSSANEEE